jgi:hypothetical protein
MRFSVKEKPVGKQRPKFNYKTKTAYTPGETRKYESKIAKACEERMLELGLKTTDKPCKVHIDIMVSVPKSYSKKDRMACLEGRKLPAKKPDTDNILKAVKDGMEHIFYDDDKQVVEDHVIKRYWEHDDCVYVEVSEVI